MTVLEALSGALLLAGSLLCVVGGIGLLRLPDFYCRSHAGGLTDTLGATLILAGLLLLCETWGVAVKLGLIAVILHVTSPTGTHALVKAAYSRGLRVATGDDSSHVAGP